MSLFKSLIYGLREARFNPAIVLHSALYAATVGVIIFLTLYRILTAGESPKAPPIHSLRLSCMAFSLTTFHRRINRNGRQVQFYPIFLPKERFKVVDRAIFDHNRIQCGILLG